MTGSDPKLCAGGYIRGRLYIAAFFLYHPCSSFGPVYFSSHRSFDVGWVSQNGKRKLRAGVEMIGVPCSW